MSGGCTDCGRKGGCDHRKGEMFGAIDDALATLYPTRRWDERDDAGTLGAPGAAELGGALADQLAARLETVALYKPGGPEEWCDYVYALCFGRTPSILEMRERACAEQTGAAVLWEEAADEGAGLEELHLRVALSSLAPFAAVQQVSLRIVREGDELVVVEAPRTGVFDPILLPRYRKLVAALTELDIRNLDFGDLTQPPPGYDGAVYEARYGCPPTVASFLFYPQPASAVTTTLLPRGGGANR